MQLDKKAFVTHAIGTRCHAFFDEYWFSYQKGEMGQEFYPELSCKKTPPDWDFEGDDQEINGTKINGTMCFMDMDGGIANLYLACNYFNEIGEDYFVFWDCRDADHDNGITQWVIWLPNEKHL